MNSHRASIIAICFILVLVLLWAGSAHLPAGLGTRSASAITLTHRMEGGMHVYSGEAPLSKACAAFGVQGEVMHEKVQITLTTQQLPGQTSCADTSLVAPFSVALAGVSAGTPVTLVLDGQELPAAILEQ